MKVKIIKDHHLYSGVVDLEEGEANYLRLTGVAEQVKEEKAKTDTKEEKTKLKTK